MLVPNITNGQHLSMLVPNILNRSHPSIQVPNFPHGHYLSIVAHYPKSESPINASVQYPNRGPPTYTKYTIVDGHYLHIQLSKLVPNILNRAPHLPTRNILIGNLFSNRLTEMGANFCFIFIRYLYL